LIEQFGPGSADGSALAALADEVNRALPAMRRSLDRSAKRLEAAHEKVDALLREMGLRR
jgi:cellobiose-specific phosphotransferase system component IIA